MRSQLRHSTPIIIGGRTKPVSPDYIVGLTDGEGCFYVLVKPPYNQNGGAIVQLSFLIKVKEEDKIILDKVCNTLGCGSVYFQHEKRINHSQCYRYTVNSHRDIINTIIP
ncbi:MAG: LAGLIDADG family homing endonuclease, partial [Nanoarchaeota archaeon]|nr:LAGLIDADG family homing endonuclease [Nanoarchaeota archaeon]